MSELSHVDEWGDVRMVDVGDKPVSRRRARGSGGGADGSRDGLAPRRAAQGGCSGEPHGSLGSWPRSAPSELIPLCHPLPLTHVAVELQVGDGLVEIEASAETAAQTGVEMEALVAASVAALTIYDMAKAVDSGMEIGEVRLLEKVKECESGRRHRLGRCLRGDARGRERRPARRAARG